MLAQRIEQGIGRGTRGGADYCVVVLIGSKLVGWIGRKKNPDFLTTSTRAAAGEIVIFARSWYNRAGVENVMGFVSPKDVELS